MTNRTDARAYKLPEGWVGEYRMVHWACYRTVMETDPKTHMSAPKLFATAQEAENAGWRILRDMEEPPMVGTGPIAGKRITKFDVAAKKLFKEARA